MHTHTHSVKAICTYQNIIFAQDHRSRTLKFGKKYPVTASLSSCHIYRQRYFLWEYLIFNARKKNKNHDKPHKAELAF